MAKRKFARPSNNPTGIGGFKPGQVANPRGANAHQPRTSSELDVQKLAQRFTRQAIATAASIMHNRDNAPNVRLAACDLILNRGHGRPIQPHSNPDLTPLDFTKMSMEELLVAVERMDQVLAMANAGQVAPAPGNTTH